jgi:hypothetical protein
MDNNWQLPLYNSYTWKYSKAVNYPTTERLNTGTTWRNFMTRLKNTRGGREKG